jgi:hypothetical protein
MIEHEQKYSSKTCMNNIWIFFCGSTLNATCKAYEIMYVCSGYWFYKWSQVGIMISIKN